MLKKKDMKVSEDTFSIAFDGENIIEAGVLGIALSNIAYIVDKVVKNEPTSENYKLQVKTFEKGSFSIDFLFVLMTIGQMAQFYTLQDAANIVSVLKGMFDIKLLLKGQKPKNVKDMLEEGYVRVEAPDGTAILAPLGSKVVIANQEVDRKVSEIAQATKIHNPNGGIKLLHGNDTYHYEKDSIEEISKQVYLQEKTNSENQQVIRVSLPVKRPVLIGDGAWTFKYGTRSISASIVDETFLHAVHQGESSYKAGDKLDVDMSIQTILSPDNQPIREVYTIEKVYGIVPSMEEEQLKI